MVEIYLARHVESEGNLQEIFTGTIDSPLTEKGVLQAEDLAKHISEEKFTKIYSSPLIRAKETASIISKKLNIPHSTITGIQEVSFGDFQGKKKSLIVDTPLELAFKLFEAPNGESTEKVYQRILDFLSYLRENIKSLSPDGKYLFIGHSNFWLYTIAVLEGKNAHDFPFVRASGNKFKNGEIRRIYI
ncbi:histidine phosphatase family protein [bacterium]|nr:histidine phosphatase family protein [bacterium]MBU1958205.1 histidine phosphatase family protein [bacterium]